MHKAGFVNIVGNPNTGKSTLMNAFMGSKFSAVTSKAQTTRHRIKGILNGDDYQIVFSDSPGVLKPNYKLQESMLRFSERSLKDADIILYVTDVNEKADKNEQFIEKIKKAEVPVLLLLNKIDLSDEEAVKDKLSYWKKELPDAELFAGSAKHKFNTDSIPARILELIPESPPFFPKDQWSDRGDRFFAQEIIREKIFLQFKEEIPYATEVQVTSFKEQPEILKIHAKIYVERESQKGILIGNQGRAIKGLGQAARRDLQNFFKQKVYLDLQVKLAKGWKDDDNSLGKFGYNED
ncbi:MAG: GTPase Era [Bacteroidota bacterium]|nr:GTPase Era [Bacteroidota bacterium]